MPTAVAGQVGEQVLSKGVSTQPFRQGVLGEAVVSELNGRFYEQNVNSRLFSGGMTLTAINNATFTSGTLGATCTPVAGVWNPATSPVDLEILQAVLNVVLTALASTGGAPFVWAASFGNSAISTGAAPFSRRTLQANGSNAKNMAGVALTGLTNNLVVLGGSSLGGGSSYNISGTATAAGFQTTNGASAENLDGQFIVPPGGVLALLATTTPVAHSAASMLLWNEVPKAS